MFYLICIWINGWVNNHEAGDLRRHRGHFDVNVMVTGVVWKETTVHNGFPSQSASKAAIWWFLCCHREQVFWVIWDAPWRSCDVIMILPSYLSCKGESMRYWVVVHAGVQRAWQLKDSISHYDDIIMSAIASQITSLIIVYSIVYSDADQRKHQSSASLAFVWGNGQLRGKCFHLMTSSCHLVKTSSGDQFNAWCWLSLSQDC